VTVPATAAPLDVTFSVIVEVLMVLGSIASLNVTVIAVLGDTPVAPFAGELRITVGPSSSRVVHDDLVHDRALRDASESEPLLRFLEQQEKLKRNGQKIRTSWNLLTYQKKMLRQEPIEWTCIAGYKYFFVSSTGKFWLCSQVRTERHILEITQEDLLSYNRKKDCQAGCGVYCTAEASLAVSHPLRYASREVAGMLASRVTRLRRGGPERIRDLTAAQ